MPVPILQKFRLRGFKIELRTINFGLILLRLRKSFLDNGLIAGQVSNLGRNYEFRMLGIL